MAEATRTDFDIPARYGVRQTIGDTLGIGGIFRALRTFPLLRALGEDIAAVCPDAWLLNYTNPMAMNVQYLTEATGLAGWSACAIRCTGRCGASRSWSACRSRRSPTGPAGVNHQAWVLEFTHDGADLYPLLDALIAADEQLRRRVRVDMYRRLGLLPDGDERALVRVRAVVPAPRQRDRAAARAGGRLPGHRRGERRGVRADAARARRPASRWPVEGTMEYAPQIIHSIVTGTPRTVYGNVPNRGLIANLPAHGDGRGAVPGRRVRRAADADGRAATAAGGAEPDVPEHERPGASGPPSRRSPATSATPP